MVLLTLLPTNSLSPLVAYASGPNVDGLTFKVYHSSNAALQGLSQGEVDLLAVDFPPEALAGLKSNPNVKLVDIPDFSFTYIGINLRVPPLDDPQFRQAMLYGFNRDKLLGDLLQGFGDVLGAGLFSSAYAKLGWQASNVQTYQYDPEKAKQLLNSGGFKVSKSGFRIDPSTGQPLTTMYIYSRLGNPIDVAIADAFAQDMQAMGIPILSLPQPSFDYGVLVKQVYGFYLFVDSESANSAPTWLYDLFSSENDISPVPLGTNLVGYHNRHFDLCANQVRTSASLDDSKNAAFMCQELLAKDLPVLPVFSKHLLIATTPSFTDIVPIVGSIPETIRQTALNTKVGGNLGGELRVGISSDFGNLDPTNTARLSDWIVLHFVVEPLLTLDQDGNLAPGLAEAWTAQGGNAVTFTLRKGAEFHNGSPLTAADAAATINWLITNTKSSSPLYSAVANIDKADVVDDRTFMISLKQSDSFAINSLAQLFVLPKDMLGSLDSGRFVDGLVLGATGPFTLSELKVGEQARLRYNPLYYDAPPDHKLPTDSIDASKGELLFGARVTSGSQVTLETKPLTSQGQPFVDANYTLLVFTADGKHVLSVPGGHRGQGVYTATLNTDDPSLTLGSYKVIGELQGISPSGQLLVLDEHNLTVREATPIVLYALVGVIIVVAVVAAVLVLRKLEPKKWRSIRQRALKLLPS